MSLILIVNKKARLEFTINQTMQAGIILSGAEVKSLRAKSGSLQGSFVKLLSGEAYLINAQITPYAYADNRDYDPKKTRKLLLTKKELTQLQTLSETRGSTLVPLQFELVGRRVKLLIGIGRGKKTHERRAELRQRAVQRDVERDLRSRLRF